MSLGIADSDRIVKLGNIPPHIPVANGLRGSSLPMKIMSSIRYTAKRLPVFL